MKGPLKKHGTGILILFLVFLILLTSLFLIEQIIGKSYPKKKSIPFETEPFPQDKKKILPETQHIPTALGEIAIILDDVGWNPDIVAQVKKIPIPLTLAILPDSPFGLKIARQLSGSPNIELFLHIPLEPEKTNTESLLSEDFLSVLMDNEELKNRFNKYLEKFSPYIVGVNNHMGSKFTKNQEKMEVLLKEIKEKKLVYIDSLTTEKSFGYIEAKKMGIKTARRDVFLDNSTVREEIIQNLLKAGEIAKNRGTAVAIGHARTNTLKVLEEKIPEMLKDGYRFIPATKITR